MAKIPSVPQFIPLPFADAGDKATLPENQTQPGRASFETGFPPETQRRLAEGGVAPNRLDFQAALNLAHQFAFYFQSGGIMPYSEQVNYVKPAQVFHEDDIWFCQAQNGPDTPVGVKVPGTDETYWTTLAQQVGESGGGSSGGIGVPVGAVMMFPVTVAPDGFLLCDGSAFDATTYPKLYEFLGIASVPDMRGLFVRGYDPDAINDPNGVNRAIATRQGDAMRNLTGGYFASNIHDSPPYGIAYPGGGYHSYGGGGSNKVMASVSINASRQVPTAAEIRPKNINLLYCIKHD